MTDVRQTFRPPRLAILYLVVAWAVDYSLSSSAVLPDGYRFWLSLVVVVVGVVLSYSTITLFERAGTTHKLAGDNATLVVEGPYRWSRNPMYLGLTLIVLGIAIYGGSVPFLLVPVAFLLTLNFAFVRWEERRLEAAFGDEYQAYRERVRRWL
ncbi:MAG: isoprenylcysteine carboxylmethyltransferase family protein [Gemmatimonadetes bacterium]|nr:isoprenylcysteine carboxylmethyltransferase family protein [Gemmatimonadota bacterium]